MQKVKEEQGDKCLNERCWTGPLMIVATTKGAIGDLCVAIKLFLAKHHGKETAQAMVGQLAFSHCHEEGAILGHAVGREPAGSILREICALAEVHANGTLRTHSATYQFRLQEHGEEQTYQRILGHYRWLAVLSQ